MMELASTSLTWRFSRSGGPGGQHVNTTESRVELLCDLASAGFAPAATQRLIDRFGPVARVVVDTHRSQARNRDEAVTRLTDTLVTAARPPTIRRPTRPRKGAVERRLEVKRATSDRKSARRWKPDD